MLTPVLEKLILCGKANYNTFVIGGSQKHILNVQNDRFIIITDIQYFSQVNLGIDARSASIDQVNELKTNHLNTQLKVFSTKSQNTFLFRNDLLIQPINADNTAFSIMPIGQTKLDTYLIHESDVSFTFSYAGQRNPQPAAITKAESIAYPPPFDYGKDGQIGSIPVRTVTEDLTGITQTANGGQLMVKSPNPANLEMIFPVVPANNATSLRNAESYPIVLVSYVEILGNPTNISATL